MSDQLFSTEAQTNPSTFLEGTNLFPQRTNTLHIPIYLKRIVKQIIIDVMLSKIVTDIYR